MTERARDLRLGHGFVRRESLPVEHSVYAENFTQPGYTHSPSSRDQRNGSSPHAPRTIGATLRHSPEVPRSTPAVHTTLSTPRESDEGADTPQPTDRSPLLWENDRARPSRAASSAFERSHFHPRGPRGRTSAIVPSGTPLYRPRMGGPTVERPTGPGAAASESYVMPSIRGDDPPDTAPALRVSTLEEDYLTVPPPPSCGSLPTEEESSFTPPIRTSVPQLELNLSEHSDGTMPSRDAPRRPPPPPPDTASLYCNELQRSTDLYANSPPDTFHPPPLPPRDTSRNTSAVSSMASTGAAHRALPALPSLQSTNTSNFRVSSHVYNSLYSKINCCHGNTKAISRWLPTVITIVLAMLILTCGLLLYMNFQSPGHPGNGAGSGGGSNRLTDKNSTVEDDEHSKWTSYSTTQATTTTTPPDDCPTAAKARACRETIKNTAGGYGSTESDRKVIISLNVSTSSYKKCIECCNVTAKHADLCDDVAAPY